MEVAKEEEFFFWQESGEILGVFTLSIRRVSLLLSVVPGTITQADDEKPGSEGWSRKRLMPVNQSFTKTQ